MKEKITMPGHSLIFNIAFVVLNLLGLSFLAMGNHESFADSSGLFNTVGLILMITTIGGLIVFKGRLMMSSVARVLVGGLFIVSGLVKANDPIGFSYKLEEYFEDGALAYRIKELFGAPSFSLEFLMDSALFLSILICIAEIVLGVLTIIGGKIKIVSYFMMFMMLFFTFLTWHTANCDNETTFVDRDTYEMSDPLAALKLDEIKMNLDNEDKTDDKRITIVSQSSSELVVDEVKKPQCVDDCGCFGDALKGSVGRSLTPGESFWKDIIVLYLVIWIFIAQRIIKPNGAKENLWYVISSMVIIVFFSWVFGWYFPILFGLVGLLGALWMLRAGGKYLGNHYGSALFVTLICGIFVTFVMFYSPLKDYRPYAVGADLNLKMTDGVEGEYESMLLYKNKKTGKEKEYSSTSKEYTDSKVWEDEDWEYKDMVQKTIVASINASIMDFNPSIRVDEMIDAERELSFVKSILDTSTVKLLKILSLEYDSEMEISIEEYELDPGGFPAEEYTILDTMVSLNPELQDVEIKDALLSQEQVVMVISKNLNEGSWGGIDRLIKIYEMCKMNDIPFLMICNATRDEIIKFREKHNFMIPVFSMDEIELKIISRSNPALIVLEKGVVKEKYSKRTIPTAEKFKTNHLN
ncbi:MAG: putative membrane protein YphA (DoxX/SURF4 family) [Flavobacteriaceae bacterium]|jgi:uncharacterized membrane protein YphA (DoxX/SURF4 family)